MRATWWSIRLLLAAVLLGTAGGAGAGVTIALEWGACGGGALPCSATGSDTISVDYTSPGVTLRLDIYLSHDLPQGLDAYVFSLNFDTSLDNELNLGPMAQTEWAGTDVHPGPFVQNFAPLTTGVTASDSSGSMAGRINSYESAGFGVLPANGVAYTVGTYTATAPARYRVGQAFFTTNSAAVDGADIFSGFFNGLFDAILDGDGNPVPTGTILFGTATVNLVSEIPEPGTLSLLGLGVVGLVLARRLGRRS